jgi:hypothetical protein
MCKKSYTGPSALKLVLGVVLGGALEVKKLVLGLPELASDVL